MIEEQENPEAISVERAELEALLASEMFRRAPILARILEYLCEAQLRGEAFIKEFEIATQAMGRSSDFDPQADGSVRVNLHHLRKKLKQFYEAEGADHAIWISLPIGQNLPTFVVRRSQPETAELPTNEQERSTGADDSSPAASAHLDTDLSMQLAAATPESVGHPTLEITRMRGKSRFSAVLLNIAFCLCTAALTISSTWFWMHRRTTAVSHPVMTDATLRIGCGLPRAYQDSAGRIWDTDAYFNGGKPFHHAVAPIDGALDSGIYQNGREGDFSYDIPVPRASYELRLYFAETSMHGEGFRAMNIWINGKRVEHLLDIISDADGFGSADEKVYTSVQPAADGRIHIQFKGTTSLSFVNAIEILPGDGDLMRPIRQTTLSTYYYDPQGIIWTPDAWFRGGRVNHIPDIFPDLPLEGLYQNERFGNFAYSIPVQPNRTYTLTLYFQDAWFSHAPPKEIQNGKRQFDVTCNGTELLHQFDILQKAGGNGSRVVKRFTGIESTAQGKLLLTFTPIQNYAMINAIEVEQEPVSATTGSK